MDPISARLTFLGRIRTFLFQIQGTTNLYSFAWIVDDVLCAIKKEKQQADTKRPSSVLLRIGQSVHEEFLNARFRLESIITAKENILQCIKSEIERVAGKECFTVNAYGSVSMYLCEQESDLDVCLSPRPAAYSKYAPKGKLSNETPS